MDAGTHAAVQDAGAPGAPRAFLQSSGVLSALKVFDFPALPVLALHKGGGRLAVAKGEFLLVPVQLLFGESRRNPAEQDGFGQRTGVIEIRRGLTFAARGVDERLPVVHAADFGPLVFLVFVFRQQDGFPYVRNDHVTLGAKQHGALSG